MKKLSILLLIVIPILSEEIAVIGSGYVGLVTAACLSMGDNKIRCVDNNCGCVSESELRPEEHEVIPSEEVQEEQTQVEQGTEQTEEPTQTQATSEVTGGFLEIDNEFLRYYYGISQK